MTQRIEFWLIPFQSDSQNWTLLFNMTHSIESFFSTWLIEIEPFCSTWLIEIEPFFSTWLIEIEPFFSTWLIEIEPFFFLNMTQRIEPTFFEHDSKNWNHFFEHDSKNCFFSIWLKNWTLFWIYLNELFFFFNLILKIEPYFRLAQRFDFFFWKKFNFFQWITSLNFFLNTTQRIEHVVLLWTWLKDFFKKCDSKNWNFFF